MRFLLLVVSLLSWGAFAQRQVCQDGVNCRVASLKATPGPIIATNSTNTVSMCTNVVGAAMIKQRQGNRSAAWNVGGTSMHFSFGSDLGDCTSAGNAPIWSYSQAGGNTFSEAISPGGTSYVSPAALPAVASFTRFLATDTATQRLWWSRGDVWRDLQSGSHPTLDRREFSFGSAVEFLGMEWHSYTPNAIGSVTPVTFVAVDGAAGSNVVASGYNYRSLNNTAVLPSTFTLSGLVTGGAYSPRMCARVRVGTLPASYRFWVTLGSADPNGADTGTGSMLGFRLVNASGKFEATTCAASVCTYTATGATVAANTAYLLCADMREGTAANFTVDALAPSRITTNLPTQNMKPWVTATPIGGLASSIGIESVTVETK